MPTIIPKDEIETGVNLCKTNSLQFLEIAQKIISIGEPRFAWILYSYAFEEYGKALLLKKDGKFYGAEKGSHQKKLNAANDEMKGVLTISPNFTVKVMSNFSPKNRVFKQFKNSNSQISTSAYATGTFEDISSKDIFEFNIAISQRMIRLYVDIERVEDNIFKKWVEPIKLGSNNIIHDNNQIYEIDPDNLMLKEAMGILCKLVSKL